MNWTIVLRYLNVLEQLFRYNRTTYKLIWKTKKINENNIWSYEENNLTNKDLKLLLYIRNGSDLKNIIEKLIWENDLRSRFE